MEEAVYLTVKIYPNVGDVFFIKIPVKGDFWETEVDAFISSAFQSWVVQEYEIEKED